MRLKPTEWSGFNRIFRPTGFLKGEASFAALVASLACIFILWKCENCFKLTDRPRDEDEADEAGDLERDRSGRPLCIEAYPDVEVEL